MKFDFFTCLLNVLVILCLQDGVKAEYCRDDITAGKCFNENIAPLVIGTTIVGCVFGFSLLILSICLFCKTRVKNGEIDWVHDREPSDWVRDVKNLGMANNGLHMEPRKQGLGDDKPQYYVSDRSLYSERATSAFPSSNPSDIMTAMDEINDDESKAPSGYYWAYGGHSGGTTPSRGTLGGGKPASGVPSGHTHGGRTLSSVMLNDDKLGAGVPNSEGVSVRAVVHGGFDDNLVLNGKDSDYATITSAKTVQSAQILKRQRKYGNKMTKDSSNGSTTTN